MNIHRGYDHAYRKLTGLPTLLRSEVTPELYVGGQYNDAGARKLKSIGITGVVNMRENRLPFNAQSFGFEVLQLPTKDQQAPTMANIEKGVAFIQKCIDDGGKVYVHCRWGEGRGPSMAAAYLISQGLTTEDAIKQIQKVRTFINPTKSQRQRLKEYEKQLRG